MKYSVTSVVLPDLDLVETCQLLQELGYEGVEWRVRHTPPGAAGKGYANWGEHKTDLSPDTIGKRAPEVARITADHGLEIPAIAANLRANETEDIKKLADGVAAMGRIPIRIGAPRGYDRTVPYEELFKEAADAYRTVLDILRPYGIKCIIEIHGGTIMVSASLACRLASLFSPEEFGVIYDVNNMTRDGFETFRIGMELLGEYLAHCHVGGWHPIVRGRRDDGALEWQWEGCDLADSMLDIPQFMADLKAVGYNGFISIEDFRDMDHRKKLRRQIAFLRSVEGRLV